MKASELVAALLKEITQHGDAEVFQNATHADPIQGVDFWKAHGPMGDRIVLRNWGGE